MPQAPPSEPIGTRDIDSTPPAKTRSSQPEATFWAAMLTASRPEAQKRLSCTPATVSGRPALIAAVLAMSAPWSPTGDTQPRTTSSTRLGSMRSLRTSISCMRPTTRSTGLVPCSEPLCLPLPRGVRMASNTNASVAAMSSGLLRWRNSGRRTLPGLRSFMNASSCRTMAAMTDVSGTRPRRTQSERSAATREALLDATIASLVEDGYANTTTARVSERAGLSRGAHLHHFQTRDTLLAAAADHLTRRRGEHLSAAVDALPPSGPDRVAQGLDLIFNSYNNPLYQATLDLWTHGRTDADLRGHLVPIERRLDRQTVELSRRL